MTRWDARRLKSIEQNLDAQETMLLWLDELRQQHDTLSDLVRSLKGQPEGMWPLHVLTEKASKTRTTERPLLSQDASCEIYAGVRDAVRDVSALYFLFVELNAGVMRERRAMWLSLLCLSHAITAWSRDGLAKKLPPIEKQVRGYLRDLVVWHAVVETICERRYQEYDVLLPGPRKELSDLKEKAEVLLAQFNDHLEFLVWKRQESGKRTAAP